MALKGLRVLEVGSLAAASWCARLFADFGADVLKLEPPGGDPLRGARPFLPTGEGEASAWFAFLNFGKRIAHEDAKGVEALVADCDVLIVGGDAADLARVAPSSAIVVDASWFGRSGPYKDFAATDAVCRALGGMTHLVGRREGPPIAAPDFQAAYVGGLWSFIAACAGLLARARDGGRRFEASVLEACVTMSEYQAAESALAGVSQQRMGLNRFVPTYPLGVYPTKDGALGVTLVTPAQWRGFCDMLGLESVGADPKFTTGLERLPYADELEALFMPKLLARTASEWFQEGLERKLPIVVVPTMADLIASENFRARGALADVEIGARTFVAPASPLRLRATPPARTGALAKAETGGARWRERACAPLFRAGEAKAGSLPLAGFRIVDFTMGWAGPLCTRVLADLGADVVKIESCAYPDWWRGVDRRPNVLRDKLYEKTGRFAAMNRNKRGVTIDLTRPEGVKLARALAMGADAVVDNYSVDVLPKLGLSPESLRAAKPGLVTLSMSAFGSSSPWRECRAYGSTLEQASGLPGLVGAHGDPPVMGHPAFGDPVGGLSGAAALLTALLHARSTGGGQHIDLGQVECMMQMVGPWMMAASAGSAAPARLGSGHPDHVPNGVYPCAAPDSWIAVAVRSDAEWPALHAVIGAPHLAPLTTADGRRARAGAIDDAIAAWTRTQDADAAMEALQKAGVAAGVARRPFDLIGDRHLVARSFWTEIERAYIGRHAQPAMAFREGAAPYPVRRAAPTLGERNREVFGEILGLGDADIAALERAGVIGSELVVAGAAPERAPA